MSETLDHHSCSGIHSSDSQESGHSLMPSKFHDYMTTFWTVQVLCIGKHANQQSDLHTHTQTHSEKTTLLCCQCLGIHNM